MGASIRQSGKIIASLSDAKQIRGTLMETFLKGDPGAQIQLQIANDSILQWKYDNETEWHDLFDLSTIDYELLTNLPTLNGNALVGELNDLFMLPSDEVTEQELMNLLNN